MKKSYMFLMVTGLAVALAGCSSASKGPATTVEVIAQNTAFSQKTITLEKGKPYKIVLKNQDAGLEHDFSIDKIPVTDKKEHHDDDKGMAGMGSMAKADVHVHTPGGQTEEIEFTPTKAGTYTFVCTVPGHKEAGMTGTVVVK